MRDIVTSAAMLCPLARLDERDSATLGRDASTPKRCQI